MAGNPEQATGYKSANVLEEKSVAVGSLALIGSVFVPALLGVAAWEGVQIVIAKDYKKREKGETTVFLPTKKPTQKEYDLAA
ncbi:MAG: hypothetical protein ACREHC_03430 [Candidatus Levyibacteriota bacterium]